LPGLIRGLLVLLGELMVALASILEGEILVLSKCLNENTIEKDLDFF
jgi:hypothetical protein